MRQTPHVENHFTATESVRDIVIGMSDGLDRLNHRDAHGALGVQVH